MGSKSWNVHIIVSYQSEMYKHGQVNGLNYCLLLVINDTCEVIWLASQWDIQFQAFPKKSTILIKKKYIYKIKSEETTSPQCPYDEKKSPTAD